MISITALAFTGYPVADITRARRFYEEVLGLQPGETWDHDGRFWIEYDIGPATLAISNIADEWKPSSDGPAAALEVADFDAAIAHLRMNRVTFVLEPTETPVCQMAVIADPDGNTLTIHRRKA